MTVSASIPPGLALLAEHRSIGMGDWARLEAAVEAFLNELDYWNSVLGGRRT